MAAVQPGEAVIPDVPPAMVGCAAELARRGNGCPVCRAAIAAVVPAANGG
jgi:hypothetical protein